MSRERRLTMPDEPEKCPTCHLPMSSGEGCHMAEESAESQAAPERNDWDGGPPIPGTGGGYKSRAELVAALEQAERERDRLKALLEDMKD